MMYVVELSDKSVKSMDKMKSKDKKAFEAVVKHLKKLQDSPAYYGKALTGNFKGLFSCRAGDLRIIYQIYERKGVVFVIAIGHRRGVYDEK